MRKYGIFMLRRRKDIKIIFCERPKGKSWKIKLNQEKKKEKIHLQIDLCEARKKIFDCFSNSLSGFFCYMFRKKTFK